MARKRSELKVDRRKFLTGVAVAGTATAVASQQASAAALPTDAARPAPAAVLPSAKFAATETQLPPELPRAAGPAGSDFMVDVIKSLDIDYIFANPASSFRGLHESLLNYGKNTQPEFITCMHEESSVGMAHGYFKVTGKPILVLVHGTVGLQHATMAIYNAWCDRVPVIVMGGNDLDASRRPPGVPTIHSAQDINALVRDFTKWDDTPVSLEHFAQSAVRAYKIAMTPPHAPVMLALDAELQEETIHDRAKLTVPKLTHTAPPQADLGTIREAAKLLVAAQAPVIVVDRVARTQNGMTWLVQLAELLQAPVVDLGGRMNFPNTHYLNQTGRRQALIGQADVVLGMELTDYWGVVNAFIDNGDDGGPGLREQLVKPGTKLISIGSVELLTKSNYQDFERYQAIDLAMAADAETSLPSLIDAVKAALPTASKDAIDKRGEAMKKAWAAGRERNRAAAAVGWDLSPITTARMSAEIWGAIRNEDWSMVSADFFQSFWPSRLWSFDRQYRHIGGSGGYGVGYGAPAAVGAALANKNLGRFSINIQADGDLMYAPGVLWTAAHHRIPILSVMHNNRGYHQELMHVQRMADRRDRVLSDGPVGTTILDPNIDYAALAKSLGLWSAGPITDPKDLGPALKRGVEVVKAGEPALIDVVSQPR
jgi:thiamine pyrophosphate-dependent acetolactate synthase large subunit-like protein